MVNYMLKNVFLLTKLVFFFHIYKEVMIKTFTCLRDSHLMTFINIVFPNTFNQI